METKHLDKKIEELETLDKVYRTLNLIEKDKLKEYKEIKAALTIPVVVSTFICHDADTYGKEAKCRENLEMLEFYFYVVIAIVILFFCAIAFIDFLDAFTKDVGVR